MTADVIQFLQMRRSVVAKKMLPVAPSETDLENIISCGLRVPDHSNVQPWKIVVIQGEARKHFDEQVILRAAEKSSTETLNDTTIQLESQRMQRSGAVLAVVCSLSLIHISEPTRPY